MKLTLKNHSDWVLAWDFAKRQAEEFVHFGHKETLDTFKDLLTGLGLNKSELKEMVCLTRRARKEFYNSQPSR